MTYINHAIHGIPGNDELPEALHAAADRWRELGEQLEDLDIEQQRLKTIGIPQARLEDSAALNAAIANNTEIPDVDVHEREAKRNLLVAERRYTATEAALDTASTELARMILAHREEIERIHKPLIESALTEYKNTVSRARAAIVAAAANLAEAGSIGELLVDLDMNATGATPSPLNIPLSLDTAPAIRDAGNVLHLLHTPTAQSTVEVVGANGIIMTMDRDVAVSLVDSGNARYA